MSYRPIVLLILDGFGIAPASSHNAVSQAKMPFYNKLLETYPHSQLEASGTAVGLVAGEMGSTEVGHLNIGAGRIVFQDLPRINKTIQDATFFTNKAFCGAVRFAKEQNSSLHLIGLTSDGHVHSSIDHLYALLKLAKDSGLQSNQVKIHAITDGRDTSPTSGIMFIAQIEDKIKELGIGEIATVLGRYYAMDRDNRWDRIEKSYKVLTEGSAETAVSAVKAIKDSYTNGVTDEFILPIAIVDNNGNPKGIIRDNDAVIVFNYRTDRPRQITKALTLSDQDFAQLLNNPFKRLTQPKHLHYVTMTDYQKGLQVQGVAFPTQIIDMPLGMVLANYNKKHLHMSETEKERFTTFFFNGFREEPLRGEERIFIPSPKVPTYDLVPEMSSYELTNTLIQKLNTDLFDFAVVNFACPDMVGHTGNLTAAIKACEAVDECLKKIIPPIIEKGGAVMITADHGNCEVMQTKDGNVLTEHTTNPVPFVVCLPEATQLKLQNGILGDIAPTILALMQIPTPKEMTGKNLLF